VYYFRRFCCGTAAQPAKQTDSRFGATTHTRKSFVLELGIKPLAAWSELIEAGSIKIAYVTWEILPESQLSHLIFRIRLPKSSKDCLNSKN
jgi:hypothetical protein